MNINLMDQLIYNDVCGNNSEKPTENAQKLVKEFRKCRDEGGNIRDPETQKKVCEKSNVNIKGLTKDEIGYVSKHV